MRFRRYMQHLHRWVGLLIVAQIVLWMASGVVMSWFPIELVRGETTTATEFPQEIPVQTYFSPGGVVAQMDGATSVTLKERYGRIVYEVEAANGTALFDADTGERIPQVTQQTVRQIAIRDFSGVGEVRKVELLSTPPHEYRGPRPVWRVSFDDKNDTRIYISQNDGSVLARRNRIWRLYDFFWMLHIMDYGDRENFNNPLVQTLSLSGFIFALSGFYLVIVRLRNGRYLSDWRKLIGRTRN